VRKHFELRCILDGRATPLAEHADTLNEAREAAEWKCRALGFEKFFELDANESFAAATADGIYLVTVQTETVARAI
jgi:hypothetical protein